MLVLILVVDSEEVDIKGAALRVQKELALELPTGGRPLTEPGAKYV